MKINKTKITITTLALAMGAALAGSISGSVAWYQYSTRASAKLAGTSAGVSRDLQVKLAAEDASAYTNLIDLGSKNFRPTSYYEGASGAEFYEHPVYKSARQIKVATNQRDITVGSNTVTTVAYAEYDLVFKCEDDLGEGVEQVAKDVYLSGFSLAKADGATSDITPAVRVRIAGTKEFIIAQSATATDTHGNLDLNGHGSGLDKDGILTDDSDGGLITYYAGADDSSYTPVLASSALVDANTNPYSFADANKVLTTTKTSGDSEAVKVQVWIEGWHKLGASGSENAIWDKAFLAQDFELKLQFACEANY